MERYSVLRGPQIPYQISLYGNFFLARINSVHLGVLTGQNQPYEGLESRGLTTEAVRSKSHICLRLGPTSGSPRINSAAL